MNRLTYFLVLHPWHTGRDLWRALEDVQHAFGSPNHLTTLRVLKAAGIPKGLVTANANFSHLLPTEVIRFLRDILETPLNGNYQFPWKYYRRNLQGIKVAWFV